MSGGSLRRLLIACVTVFAVGAAAAPAQAASPAPNIVSAWKASTGTPHVMRQRGSTSHPTTGALSRRPAASSLRRAAAAATTNGGGQLAYFGGQIQNQPRVFLDFWGSDWQTGFTDSGGFSSLTAQIYIETFFQGAFGSRWFNSQTQYCQGIASGATSLSCPGNALHVGALSSLQIWNDSAVPAPTAPTSTMIATEADAAATHFSLVNDVNATVLVL